MQELLTSWAAHVAVADLIFVHAPASNSRALFSEGQTTLLPSDPRLRRVPFVTHRPTFSETKRVLRLLCAVFRPEAEAVEQLLRAQHGAHAEVRGGDCEVYGAQLGWYRPWNVDEGNADGAGADKGNACQHGFENLCEPCHARACLQPH